MQDGADRYAVRLERQGEATVATIERTRDGQLLDTLRLSDASGGVDGTLTPTLGAASALQSRPLADGGVLTLIDGAAGGSFRFDPQQVSAERERLEAAGSGQRLALAGLPTGG